MSEESVFTNPVDELALEEHLQREIGYAKAAALRHDVECVAGIERLRHGVPQYEIESSTALFVTTNTELAWAAKTFFNVARGDGRIPPCLTDYSLGSLLWLKGPSSAPELPRRLVIAEAYAATQPPDDLWKSYLAEIHKLRERGVVPEHDYSLLRFSTTAKRAVMDLTKGYGGAFTEGTVAEVLAIAHEQVRADLNAELSHAQKAIAKRDARIEEVEAEKGVELHRVSSEIAQLTQSLKGSAEEVSASWSARARLRRRSCRYPGLGDWLHSSPQQLSPSRGRCRTSRRLGTGMRAARFWARSSSDRFGQCTSARP